jgi:hypothetical protein
LSTLRSLPLAAVVFGVALAEVLHTLVVRVLREARQLKG